MQTCLTTCGGHSCTLQWGHCSSSQAWTPCHLMLPKHSGTVKPREQLVYQILRHLPPGLIQSLRVKHIPLPLPASHEITQCTLSFSEGPEHFSPSLDLFFAAFPWASHVHNLLGLASTSSPRLRGTAGLSGCSVLTSLALAWPSLARPGPQRQRWAIGAGSETGAFRGEKRWYRAIPCERKTAAPSFASD